MIRFICWGLEKSGNGYAARAFTCDEVEKGCMDAGQVLSEGTDVERFKISLWWGLLFGVFAKK